MIELPADYLAFVEQAESKHWVGNQYLALWNPNDLASLNRAYQVDQYVPGLLIFGSDGGGEAYGFDTRHAELPVVCVPFIGMAWDVAIPMGKTFSDFIENLRASA